MSHMKVNVDFNNCCPSEAADEGDDARCICGSLVARVVEGGVELKCRRCRRIVLVPIDVSARASAVSWVSQERAAVGGTPGARARPAGRARASICAAAAGSTSRRDACG